MSAFVISKAHVDAMLAAGLHHRRASGGWVRWYGRSPRRVEAEAGTPEVYLGQLETELRELRSERADEVGEMLVRECVRSVSHRYPDNEALPGPVDPYWLESYRYRPPSRVPRRSRA